MFTANFWKQAAERVIKSAAQALLGLWIFDRFDVLQTDWLLILNTALGAAVLSLLTSIVTERMGEPNDPSAVKRTWA